MIFSRFFVVVLAVFAFDANCYLAGDFNPKTGICLMRGPFA